MPDVYFTERGHERLTELDDGLQDRIKDKLRDAREHPDHYLKPLTARDDYALRIGDYRALIEWDKHDDVLYVKSIGHRRNFYDGI